MIFQNKFKKSSFERTKMEHRCESMMMAVKKTIYASSRPGSTKPASSPKYTSNKEDMGSRADHGARSAGDQKCSWRRIISSKEQNKHARDCHYRHLSRSTSPTMYFADESTQGQKVILPVIEQYRAAVKYKSYQLSHKSHRYHEDVTSLIQKTRKRKPCKWKTTYLVGRTQFRSLTFWSSSNEHKIRLPFMDVPVCWSLGISWPVRDSPRLKRAWHCRPGSSISTGE